MNPRHIGHEHRILIVEFAPLEDFQSFLADYSDDWELVDETSLLLYTMNFLSVANNLGEAKEGLEIHIGAYCQTREFAPYMLRRLDHAISLYVNEMHRLFTDFGLYGRDDYLAYAFNYWHTPFAAVFVPYSHIQQYPKARTSVVQYEPYGKRSNDVFPAVYDPDIASRIYNATLRNEDVIPF